MKKIKAAIIIIVSIIVLSVLFYFFPPKKLIGQLPFLNRFYNNTTLEIIVQKGKAKVSINEKDQGETPVTVEDLPEGKYLVELERIAPENSFYKKHSFNIDLAKNTTARIDLEIGPEELLHGTILYYTPMRSPSGKGFLTITGSSPDAKIYVDKEFMNRASITNLELKEGEHKVKIENDGHQTIEIPILVREKYQLNLKVHQFPIPTTEDIVDASEV